MVDGFHSQKLAKLAASVSGMTVHIDGFIHIEREHGFSMKEKAKQALGYLQTQENCPQNYIIVCVQKA